MTSLKWASRRFATAAILTAAAIWMPEGFAESPPGDAPADVTFRVSGVVKGPHVESETETAVASAEDSVVPCDSIDITLTIGRLSVTNAGHDARVSFSELPPGKYDYTVTCYKARHLQGDKQGSLVIENDGRAMAEVEVLVPMTPVEVLTAQGFSTGADAVAVSGHSVVWSTPDQAGGDLDSKVRDLTVLTSVGYVTSRAAHQGIEPLATTDLGIWNLAASFTPERRLSFSGSLTGLAKTPYGQDARALQGASGAIAYAFHKHLAIGANAGWSPGLTGTKDVRSAGLGLVWRARHSEFVKTEMSLGATGFQIRPDGDGSSTRGGAELNASAELQFCWNTCERRYGATSLGFDAGIPLYHSDADSGAVGSKLDASLGFHVGNFMRINKTFDVYLDVAWRDRGDRRDVRTELPVLVGGFDQIHMSLGAIFYFGFGANTVHASERDVYGAGPV